MDEPEIYGWNCELCTHATRCKTRRTQDTRQTDTCRYEKYVIRDRIHGIFVVWRLLCCARFCIVILLYCRRTDIQSLGQTHLHCPINRYHMYVGLYPGHRRIWQADPDFYYNNCGGTCVQLMATGRLDRCFCWPQTGQIFQNVSNIIAFKSGLACWLDCWCLVFVGVLDFRKHNNIYKCSLLYVRRGACSHIRPTCTR